MLWTSRLLALALAVCVAGCATQTQRTGSPSASFTIAVIPDTQNYVDYHHQKDAGSPVDGQAMFLAQMHAIKARLRANGGDVAFVASVGDVWQHQSLDMDDDHRRRGFRRAANPAFDPEIGANPKTYAYEIPLAREGYAIIADQTPFGVAPGNHDYDAFWTDANHPPKAQIRTRADAGLFHVGGLDGFRSVFGEHTPFFRGKPWYVAAHDGGADSAQIFEAGGYRFLHIVLQFDPPDDSLVWAEGVIERYPGLPTIVTTHNYLNPKGERLSDPAIDSHVIDPVQNTPEMLWEKFISRHDQIFMVLCGHQAGQAFSIATNRFGHAVYQILADYQDRAQTLIATGAVPGRGKGIGDGWMRFMRFDMDAPNPTVAISTWSSEYRQGSRTLETYAAWYKAAEKPDLSDADYLDQDDFSFEMTDFRKRFPAGK